MNLTSIVKRPFKKMFASSISQEYSTKILRIANFHGARVIISPKGCNVGTLGFYAEFRSVINKRLFLIRIRKMYNKENVWAA